MKSKNKNKRCRPCIGTFAFSNGVDRRPPFIPSTDATLLVPLLLLLWWWLLLPLLPPLWWLLLLVVADGMLAVDLANSLDAVMPLLVRTGRCVVVIFVNAYGGNSFKINESIIRAMCWKLLAAFWTLLRKKIERKNWIKFSPFVKCNSNYAFVSYDYKNQKFLFTLTDSYI